MAAASESPKTPRDSSGRTLAGAGKVTLLERMNGRFQEFLAAKGLKFTNERRTILDICTQLSGHIIAEDLLQEAQAHRKRISKATVYRALALLVEAGILREYRFTQNKVYYQLVAPGASHAHMVCLNCGKILEFDTEQIDPYVHGACSAMQFDARYYQLQVFGVCRECHRRREDQTEGPAFDPRTHPVWRRRHLR